MGDPLTDGLREILRPPVGTVLLLGVEIAKCRSWLLRIASVRSRLTTSRLSTWVKGGGLSGRLGLSLRCLAVDQLLALGMEAR